MSASQKQITANRKNAQKSTGPKTKKGKQKSSQNSVRHGLYTTDLIINSPALKESPQQYHHLLKSIFEELNPVGIFEEQLVLKIVNCLWRTQRAARAETAEIQKQLERVDSEVDSYFTSKMFFADDDEEVDPEEEKRTTSNFTAARTIPEKPACLNILRYETRLDRQLARYYKILTQSQALRLAREKISNKDKTIPHILPQSDGANTVVGPRLNGADNVGGGFSAPNELPENDSRNNKPANDLEAFFERESANPPVPFIPPIEAGPNGAGPQQTGADNVGGGSSAPNDLPQSEARSNTHANDLEAFFERETARSPVPPPEQAGFIPFPEIDDDDDEDDINETTGNARYIAQANAKCMPKAGAKYIAQAEALRKSKSSNTNPPDDAKKPSEAAKHNNQNIGSEAIQPPKKDSNWRPRRRLRF